MTEATAIVGLSLFQVSPLLAPEFSFLFTSSHFSNSEPILAFYFIVVHQFGAVHLSAVV